MGYGSADSLRMGGRSSRVPGGFDAAPELREILDAHLDSARRPAAEVRAFFGRRLPWLAALDASWVERNLSRIFPADEGSIDLHQTAWRGYILWNRATLGMFRMLRSQYDGAVDRIQPTAVHDHSHDDRDRQLGRHLMTMYWHGEFGLDSEDKLLSRFFSKAPASLRADAVRFLGMAFGARKLRLRGGTGAPRTALGEPQGCNHRGRPFRRIGGLWLVVRVGQVRCVLGDRAAHPHTDGRRKGRAGAPGDAVARRFRPTVSAGSRALP